MCDAGHPSRSLNRHARGQVIGSQNLGTVLQNSLFGLGKDHKQQAVARQRPLAEQTGDMAHFLSVVPG
jgi:hypothetical protein